MLSVLFFVYLSDAILSDFTPGYIQGRLGGSMMMGIIMSFSSVVGFGADLIFPQLLKATTVKKLVALAIVSSVGFSLSLLFSTWWPMVVMFLVAMAIWGVYYELLGFANQQFVSETVTVPMRSAVWAVLGVFKSMAYFLGPILSGYLMVSGERTLLMVTLGLSVLGLVAFFLARMSSKKVDVEVEHINIFREIGHWRVLFAHVWPVVLVSLMLGLIDATFWTTGTVWTDKLAGVNRFGGMFLSFYMLPTFFVGFVVARMGIYEHKKKIAEISLLIGSLLLMAIGISGAVWWQLTVVLLSSAFLAAAWPLTDAVYTDIVARMGRERKHLIGLSNSTTSLAYIIGPLLAGGLGAIAGEMVTFVAIGGVVAIIAAILIFITPKKLKLPQEEIKSWE